MEQLVDSIPAKQLVLAGEREGVFSSFFLLYLMPFCTNPWFLGRNISW